MKYLTILLSVYGFMMDVPALPLSFLLGIIFVLFVSRKRGAKKCLTKIFYQHQMN